MGGQHRTPFGHFGVKMQLQKHFFKRFLYLILLNLCVFYYCLQLLFDYGHIKLVSYFDNSFFFFIFCVCFSLSPLKHSLYNDNILEMINVSPQCVMSFISQKFTCWNVCVRVVCHFPVSATQMGQLFFGDKESLQGRAFWTHSCNVLLQKLCCIAYFASSQCFSNISYGELTGCPFSSVSLIDVATDLSGANPTNANESSTPFVSLKMEQD